MRQMLREIGRAPARIVTSVFALALAVGAIGVFAIPAVASSSLQASVDADRMSNLVLSMTDSGSADLDVVVGDADNVSDYDGQVLVEVGIGTDPSGAGARPAATLPMVGIDPNGQNVDVVSVTSGRLPRDVGEIVVADGVATVGDSIAAIAPYGRSLALDVVGIGSTSYWWGSDVAFSTLETARQLAGVAGFNRVAVRAVDDSTGALERTTDDVRDRFAATGVTFTNMPVALPDGTHPIEADISQVSTLIGFLGIVAGLVALVLLGSTTTTLITERTREVAVMRSLGARHRELRRRLRRLAVGIAAAAVVVGVPIGIGISNLIARLVLQEFVGITPAIAVSWPVVVASALFALVGARLVAGGAARRVTRIPLASALRDRDGQPFGRRRSERLAAHIRLGGLLDRAALRNLIHRRSRSVAIFAEITAAVAALLIIASLATTINAFNDAELEPWSWTSRTVVAGDGLDIDAAVVASDPTSEVAIESIGDVDGWEVDLVGLAPDTMMIDRSVDSGTWLTGTRPDEVVVSTGFAEHLGIDVGDEVVVELATGPARSRVIGLHPLRGRAVFYAADDLATILGQPGRANVVFSTADAPAVEVGTLTTTTQLADWKADDSGRAAILLIFGAIGAIVVSVAGLAVASGVAVNVFERRHELAAIRSIGGRSRDVMRVVSAELLPLALAGLGVGVVAGYFGSTAIMRSFENADAVEIGLVFATGVIPVAAVVVVLGCLAIAGSMVRRVNRRSLAETLRTST
jgi:putative ABC transport system permease protein